MKIVSKAAALDCLALGVTFDYDLPFLILYWRQILMYCTGDLPCLILLRCLWKSRLFRVFSLSLVSACFWEEELCPGSESQEPQSFSLPWTVSPLNLYLLSPLYHPEFNTQMKWINLVVSCNEEKRQGKETKGRKNDKDTQTVLTTLQFSQSDKNKSGTKVMFNGTNLWQLPLNLAKALAESCILIINVYC